jgi:hypothetical protein
VSVVFLFGAGASYGSIDCAPYCPPLGKDLFPELLKSSGFTTTIEGELRSRFEENFEKGMQLFLETRNIELPILLREMSAYFIRFTPGPNNLYRRLATKLSEWQNNPGEHDTKGIVLATLNYDLLLEQTILNEGFIVGYPFDTDGKHYIFRSNGHRLRQAIVDRYWARYKLVFPVKTPAFEVLKVHGSCNFIPDVPPESFRDVMYENYSRSAIEAPGRPVLPAGEMHDWLNRSDYSLAPAISMYAEGKQVLFSPSYVQLHQLRFQAAIEEAEKIFLIGVAIHRPDTHVWDHIAASEAWLGYVGGEPDDFRAWCSETEHLDYRVLGKYFKDSLPAIEEELDNTVP